MLFFVLFLVSTLSATQIDHMNLVGVFPIGESYSASPHGNYLAVTAGYGFRILDLTNPSHPQHISSIRTPGKISNLKWVGNYIYATLMGTGVWGPPETTGLVIIDATDPHTPFLLYYYDTNAMAISLAIKDNVVFMGILNKLITLDVSNPTNPQQIQFFSMTTPNKLEIEGDLLIAAAQTSGTKIFDISNPLNIQELSTLSGYSNDAQIWGQHLFVNSGNFFGIQVADISDPANPTILDTLDLPADEQYAGMTHDNQYFYLATYQDSSTYPYKHFSLYKIDISNLSNPLVISSFNSTDFQTHNAWFSWNGNNRLFIATDNGVRIIDPNSSTDIQQLSYYFTNYNIQKIKTAGNYLYAHFFTTNNQQGLLILNLNNPGMPIEESRLTIHNHVGMGEFNLDVNGNYAYIAHTENFGDTLTSNGITVINISDPANPQEETVIPLQHSTSALAVDATHIYTADIDTVFFWDKNNQTIIGYTPLGWNHNVTQLKVEGNWLLVGCDHAVDLFEITSTGCLYRGSYEFPNAGWYNYHVNDLSMEGTLVFVSTNGDSGLMVLEASDPTQIHKLSSMPYAQSWSVVARGTYGYVANGMQGVRTIDFSDPGHPQEIGFFNQESFDAVGLANYGSFVCAAYRDIMVLENTYISQLGHQEKHFPENIHLFPNYPNPFNPETTIRFELPRRSWVRLTVYNTLGETVQELINRTMSAGIHTVRFKAHNLPSGIYYYRIRTDHFQQTGKMMLVR